MRNARYLGAEVEKAFGSRRRVIMSRLSVTLATVPDRDYTVAEVWYGDEMVAEVNRDASNKLFIELYPKPDGTVWKFELNQFDAVIAEAELRILTRVDMLSSQPRLNSRGRPWLRALFYLGILAVVIAIVAPNFIRARATGAMSPCMSNLRNIATALEMYARDHGGKYPSSLERLIPHYLKGMPECHLARKVTYFAAFGVYAPLNPDSREDYYYVACFGENHTSVGVSGDFPAYSPVQGLIERRPEPR